MPLCCDVSTENRARGKETQNAHSAHLLPQALIPLLRNLRCQPLRYLARFALEVGPQLCLIALRILPQLPRDRQQLRVLLLQLLLSTADTSNATLARQALRHCHAGFLWMNCVTKCYWAQQKDRK